jgi:hypothetical protein
MQGTLIDVPRSSFLPFCCLGTPNNGSRTFSTERYYQIYVEAIFDTHQGSCHDIAHCFLQNHHSQKLASTTYEAKKEIDTEKTTVSCRHFNLLLDCSSAHSYNMVDFAKRPEVTVSTMVSGGLLQRSSDRQRRRIPFRNLPCNSECE